ncbi:1973_t:CDS:2 [Funneliformis caledonium]|uniref:1973_t:CDS:1 n=1 Tax=Funneliformis caledonium TaxID=1117310 RepID=A0A9N8ZYF6_9GLOM|nr:1973_t:CDS:2 [Funneliformis caledonium]
MKYTGAFYKGLSSLANKAKVWDAKITEKLSYLPALYNYLVRLEQLFVSVDK